jgi:tripartite-type tricarboxylate transporter receptor subunit TctC
MIRAAAFVLLAAACNHAFAAEAWPAKPVRVIVPFPPGGYVDLGTRLVASPLAVALGQQVVVENRGGAGGVVGTELAARAAPDGYTLVVGSVGTHAVNQSLYAKLPYNVVRDFAAIARLSDSPNVLAVHPSLPVRSVRELIALARARPAQINYASAGSGTSTHLAAVLFENLARVQLVHVAYKGGGPAIIDVVAGQVPVTFGTAASVTPHTKSGRLRGLAVTGAERSTLLPELPTIAESGLKGYEMLNWLGMFAPAGTPRAVVERLSNEVTRIVRLPEVRERLNAQGAEPAPLAADECAAFVKNEIDKWAKVVAATRMTAD